MEYVDHVGIHYSIEKVLDGWTIMEELKGRRVKWGRQMFNSPREADMWLKSYANTFHWKELRNYGRGNEAGL